MSRVGRRTFVAGSMTALLGAGSSGAAERSAMHGLIGRMTAVPGQRDALIAILLEGVDAMPGCLSYGVAEDPEDADAIWITEVWDSAESHTASLGLPAVKDAIRKARPLIAGMDNGRMTRPVGGHGL